MASNMVSFKLSTFTVNYPSGYHDSKRFSTMVTFCVLVCYSQFTFGTLAMNRETILFSNCVVGIF